MHQELGTVVLDGGERVSAAVVCGPDADWADRLTGLLKHKGEPWNWGNIQVLTQPTGLQPYFYFLHRNGIPFSNIMTVEVNGVGLLGHVYTSPEDRRKSACGKLMDLQMEHFRARGGKALFLGTGFESSAYRIYARHGFQGIEDKSGYMQYCAGTREAFDAAWFARRPVEIEPLAMSHWPILAPLFAGSFQGQVRCAPLGIIGRNTGEGYILRALYDNRLPVEGRSPSALVLRSKPGGAPVGFAAYGNHPIWSELCLVDIFCHPDFWDRAGDLLASLSLPPTAHFVTYADVGWTDKDHLLHQAGFRQTAVLKRWAPRNAARTSFVDVAVYEKA
jgi:hypothetical protein